MPTENTEQDLNFVQDLSFEVPIDAAFLYRTTADADAYFRHQLYASDWTNASEDDRGKALLAATRAVDSLKYRGYKKAVFDLLEADPDATDSEIQDAYDSQLHQFPRDEQDAGTVPDDVFWAVCEEALVLLSGKRPDEEYNNLPLTADGAGSYRVSMDRSVMPLRHTSHFITSPTAWKYLLRWLDPNANTFSVNRR